jgi:hypothetical protein
LVRQDVVHPADGLDGLCHGFVSERAWQPR